MDWFSWLSRTNLEPSLIYEYGLAFSLNELEHEDISHFNHEFLQSMGISIAKHRLEILKLARRDKKLLYSAPRSVSRILFAIKKTKICVVECIRGWIHREESSQALVVVPRSTSRRSYGSGKWKRALLKRNKSLAMHNNKNYYNYSNSKEYSLNSKHSGKQEALLLTNGTPCRLESFKSPLVCDHTVKEEKVYYKQVDDDDEEDDDDDDAYWRSDLEQIKWDSMFQDLKPT